MSTYTDDRAEKTTPMEAARIALAWFYRYGYESGGPHIHGEDVVGMLEEAVDQPFRQLDDLLGGDQIRECVCERCGDSFTSWESEGWPTFCPDCRGRGEHE